MDRLMRPRSVVVLGASTDPGKFSHRPLAYLRKLGFQGPVYPVHPGAAEIAGYPCYRSLDDVPGEVDVALIARPAQDVPQEVERCLARGIRAFVVLSGGFAESGPEGAALQEQIAQACRAHGAVMCGPNGTGLFDAQSGAALSFMTNLDEDRAKDGTVALVSGSGSIAAMLYQGRARVFHSVASIGNEAVTTGADFIADAVEQAGVNGVISFLEGIRDTGALVRALDRARELGKPVAILKGGRTEQSAKVAATHTGALVDDDTALQALLEHHLAIRADSIEELKLLASLMRATDGRSLGPRVGVLTPSGGTAVLIVDELAQHGLQLPELAPATHSALQTLIPQSSPGNPMDITGFGASSREIFADAISIMLADDSVDVLIVPMGGGVGAVGTLRAAALIDAASRTAKLLVPIWQGTTREQPGYDALQDAGLPVMTDYSLLVKALGKLARHRTRMVEGLAQPPHRPRELPAPARAAIAEVVQGEASSLDEPTVKALLKAAGVDVPALRLLPPGELPKGDAGVPFPAVLKVVSPQILHKSAVGGVLVVHDAAQLPAQCQQMMRDLAARAPGADVRGFLLEEMVQGGLELLVGVKRNERYGALLTLALGGGWANALRGAVSTLLPLSESGARALTQRFFAELPEAGVLSALEKFLLDISAIAEALGERLDVLEVNPVKLIGGPAPRAVALDGVLTLQPATASRKAP